MAALASDLAAALDRVVFAQRAGLAEPDAWQVDVLRSEAPNLLLNVHRQGGKSLMAALLGLHLAIYTPDSTCIIVSKTLHQAQELFGERLMRAFNALGRPVAEKRSNLTGLWLANGSRVLCMPGSEGSVRGPSADMLVLDEAAQISDELMAACLPMLAVTQGRTIALSTPWTSSGWFAEAWHSDRQTWERYRFPASANPRMRAAFLADQRVRLGDFRYLREYECEFGADEFAMFDKADIEAIFRGDDDDWWP